MVYLTRRMRFNAAHKLWVREWSEEQNLATFGKCANKNWHGHNYDLHVTVKGEPDPTTGFVMDAKKLRDIIQAEVIDDLDHSNLNLDVDWLPKDLQPTTENVVIHIWRRLADKVNDGKLHCVKLYETENIYAEYLGE
ncbi:6-pyruvoyl tetrahydrobiopterin synthase [Lewinellaceae bacterium SD302]|nr:6-pyruvoyl tetrahydrobiopterin synthase [Lewinellaceae bacterium SD302]